MHLLLWNWVSGPAPQFQERRLGRRRWFHFSRRVAMSRNLLLEPLLFAKCRPSAGAAS